MTVADPAGAGLTADVGSDRLAISPDRFLNRELSWLAFNRRVLAQAADASLPLLERLKFLAIHGSNLDEFFQVRVAGLKDQVAGEVAALTPDGRTPLTQLDEIHDEVDRQLLTVAETWTTMRTRLGEAGVSLLDIDHLTDAEHEWATAYFDNEVFPVLTPLAVDLGRPFPFISNLSLNLGVIVRRRGEDAQLFARIKVPPILPRFVELPDGGRFVRLEQLIGHHVGRLFPGNEILGHVVFRVTRNADLAIDEGEADDLLEAVEMELRRRRFRSVVRLEIENDISDLARGILVDELDLAERDVYVSALPLGLSDLWQLHGLDRPDLKEPSWKSVPPPELHGPDGVADVFEVLRRGDVLVHHPYTSFSGSVSEFVRQAALDPQVLALKLTLYRTSGDSPIVESLIQAAEAGKQVAVVVELKARFDEEQNIGWARRLERAGVHVAYGLAGLKVHTKVALVVRKETSGIRRYCHVGTGNYNSKTARLYEDFGLLTSDEAVGAEVGHLFNTLTGFGHDVDYQRLLVAPDHMRTPLLGHIEREAAFGARGRIVMKMNSLVDADMIDALYAASAAGVSIDLLVRGICCLRPGVDGLSENIRVRSIIGRYLEHSRCYVFGNGDGPDRARYYIGSADLMPRNLDRRVEALVAVTDPQLQRRIDIVLQTGLADGELAWVLDGDGQWRRDDAASGRATHEVLRELEQGRERNRRSAKSAAVDEGHRRRWWQRLSRV